MGWCVVSSLDSLRGLGFDSIGVLGKKGIGLGKRARSPGTTERLAKMAKMEEIAKHGEYRSRARDEYKNRQAEGRLGAYFGMPFLLCFLRMDFLSHIPSSWLLRSLLVSY